MFNIMDDERLIHTNLRNEMCGQMVMGGSRVNTSADGALFGCCSLLVCAMHTALWDTSMLLHCARLVLSSIVNNYNYNKTLIHLHSTK